MKLLERPDVAVVRAGLSQWNVIVDSVVVFWFCFVLCLYVYQENESLHFTSLRSVHRKVTVLRVSFSVHWNSEQGDFMIVFSQVVTFCH